MGNQENNKKNTIQSDALLQDVTSVGEAIEFAIKLGSRKNKDVAALLGVSESTVSELINNKRDFKAKWISPFCKFVDNNFLIEWLCFEMGLTKPVVRGEELSNTEQRLVNLEAQQRKTAALMSEVQAAFNKFQQDDD